MFIKNKVSQQNMWDIGNGNISTILTHFDFRVLFKVRFLLSFCSLSFLFLFDSGSINMQEERSHVNTLLCVNVKVLLIQLYNGTYSFQNVLLVTLDIWCLPDQPYHTAQVQPP